MRVLLIAVIAGCATAPPPCETTPSPVETSAPAPALSQSAPEYEAGQRVWIRFEQSWYPGRIVERITHDVYEAGYEGYGSDWNRVARPNQLRPYDQPPASSDLASTPPNALPQQGYPVNDITQIHDNMRVLILWNETWWPGVVQSIQGDQALIRYDGYDASSDELVGVDRLSIPRE